MDRDRRRQFAEKQKSTVDLKKKKEKKRNLDRPALETHRAKSRQRGEPEEESPDEDDGGDGDDDSDDSEGMASRLDRILEGPHPTIVDVPRTEAPKGAPSGPRKSQQRQPSPRRSRADTPPEPAPGRTVPCPQPPPASKVGHRVKSLMTGPLTRGRAVASSKGGTDRRSASPGAGQAGDAELRPAPAREGPGAHHRKGWPLLPRSGRLCPLGSILSRSGGRRRRRSTSRRRGNSCVRDSSSRSRKKERRSGGQGDPCSRSCWSRIDSRSYGSSRSSSSRGASS